MKKLISKSSFEVIFSLSLFAILCLPPLVMAQTQKDFEIKIVNGDTTINGKDIKKLTAQERKDAMTELSKMGGFELKSDGKSDNTVTIRRNTRRGGKMDVLVERPRGNNLRQPPHMNGNDDPASSPYKTDFYSNNDALEQTPPRIRLRRLTRVEDDSNMARRGGREQFRIMEGPQVDFRVDRFRPNGPNSRPRIVRFNNRNVQNFDFENTDKNGISTRISFRVTDALPERDRPMPEPEKNYLNLSDLSLSPEFSTGKTLISFNLPAKTNADVKLTGTDGLVLISSKVTGGSFSKKVSLPLNGAYTLTVKQGVNSVTKRIVKED